jgi:arylsulfatase A-like enzyme
VGLQHVIVALTSDHGVAPIPEEQAARHMPGGRITGAEILDPLKAALNAAFGEADWVLGTAGTSVYLNRARIRELGLDAARVRQVAATAIAEVPHVARVFTRDQLLLGQVPPDPFCLRVFRSYNPERSGDLEILLEPYWMRASKGTTHGTPFTYDTHIPLLLMGPGIRPGRYHRHVDLNDLAPTLATLVGTEVPSGSRGRVLDEMLDAGGD